MMQGWTVVAFLLAALVTVQAQPVYDEGKRVICPYMFPDTANYVNQRLNETVFHLEGPNFHLMAAIDAALEKVVATEVTACLAIGKLVASVKVPTVPPPVPTIAPVVVTTVAPCTVKADIMAAASCAKIKAMGKCTEPSAQGFCGTTCDYCGPTKK